MSPTDCKRQPWKSIWPPASGAESRKTTVLPDDEITGDEQTLGTHASNTKGKVVHMSEGELSNERAFGTHASNTKGKVVHIKKDECTCNTMESSAVCWLTVCFSVEIDPISSPVEYAGIEKPSWVLFDMKAILPPITPCKHSESSIDECLDGSSSHSLMKSDAETEPTHEERWLWLHSIQQIRHVLK
jgi:hypothetical protein